jgi:hypothetical protein
VVATGVWLRMAGGAKVGGGTEVSAQGLAAEGERRQISLARPPRAVTAGRGDKRREPAPDKRRLAAAVETTIAALGSCPSRRIDLHGRVEVGMFSYSYDTRAEHTQLMCHTR